jgi:hypothetical protein
MTPGDIMKLVGQGYILLVGIDYAHLIPRPNRLPAGTPDITVPYSAVVPLMHSHHIAEINEDGYPPPAERKNSRGYKMGWREMGLEPPKEGQAYYLLLQ